ncbi:MAG TPA: hypothetical protein VGE60_05660, partial [Telluria sp.]
MQSFSTEFPVGNQKTGADFIAAVKEWILDSRYTHFRAQDLKTLGEDSEARITVATDSVEFLKVETDDTESLAVSYKKRD